MKRRTQKDEKSTGQPELLAQLRQSGLNEREAQVYLALLQSGTSSATELSRLSGIPRTHLYQVVETLEQKGLITRAEVDKIYQFTARHPSALISFYQQRFSEMEAMQEALQQVVPVLAGLLPSKAQSPVVQMSHGTEAMKQAYREMLSKPFVSVFNPKLTYDMFTEGTVKWAFGRKKEVKGRELIVDSSYVPAFVERSVQTRDYRYRILPKGVQLDLDVMVSGSITTLFFYDDELSVIRMDNAHVADRLREAFELVWKMSREPSKGR